MAGGMADEAWAVAGCQRSRDVRHRVPGLRAPAGAVRGATAGRPGRGVTSGFALQGRGVHYPSRMTIARTVPAVALAAALAGCGVQSIPQAENAVAGAWGEVQNQYQRRADLVPNLVETVKGYAAHEKETLEGVRCQ